MPKIPLLCWPALLHHPHTRRIPAVSTLSWLYGYHRSYSMPALLLWTFFRRIFLIPDGPLCSDHHPTSTSMPHFEFTCNPKMDPCGERSQCQWPQSDGAEFCKFRVSGPTGGADADSSEPSTELCCRCYAVIKLRAALTTSNGLRMPER